MSRADMVADRYRMLLSEHEWLHAGFSWTIVRAGVSSSHSWLSRGALPDFRHLEPREPEGLDLVPIEIVFVVRSGEHLIAVQVERPSVDVKSHIRHLSGQGPSWSLTWNMYGDLRFLYAADREIRADSGADDFVLLAPEGLPRETREAIARLKSVAGMGSRAARAALMATFEKISGFRLDEEWLQSNQPAILLEKPLTQLPPCPSALETTDPDLYALLRTKPEASRIAVLSHVVDRLAEQFGFDWESLKEARRAVSRRDVLSGKTRQALTEETFRLGRDWRHAPGGTADEEALWSRWEAGIATRLAVRAAIEDPGNFEALYLAGNAMKSGWSSLRDILTSL
ncbi:hypothetical protein GT755_14095 [Herbidospora sp. NEAU-GS84]|uniref:Uncharacterized protein n=1 Tax=Herbidospora solisilvae TaxID=2696284 RepID=A0A7C9NNC6_9ACTN|nr:hypothetical protein [Herbidospora solisilvae]NAS22816.1 hypothetical protein [Herbidospora solisilvae]